MNITTSGVHGVVSLDISTIQRQENVRWQVITAVMADGSWHETTYYLKPDCEGLLPYHTGRSIGGEQKLPGDIGGYR